MLSWHVQNFVGIQPLQFEYWTISILYKSNWVFFDLHLNKRLKKHSIRRTFFIYFMINSFLYLYNNHSFVAELCTCHVSSGMRKTSLGFSHLNLSTQQLVLSIYQIKIALICAWTNDLANNRDAGDLRSHRTCYDVTVMSYLSLWSKFVSTIFSELWRTCTSQFSWSLRVWHTISITFCSNDLIKKYAYHICNPSFL